MTFYTRGLALDSRHPRFIPLRIADRRPRLVATVTASLSPVVKYHGLARCHLTRSGFLVRPLLNGGTLARPQHWSLVLLALRATLVPLKFFTASWVVAMGLIPCVSCKRNATSEKPFAAKPSATGVAAVPAVPSGLRDGDLIFQESTSRQSEMVRALTGSRWTHMGVIFNEPVGPLVLEAASPVRKTPFRNWVSHGRDQVYVIKRLRDADARLPSAVVEKMRKLSVTWLGRPYDLRFRWDDDALYCSELANKLFDRAAQVRLGKLERAADMNLNDERVQKAIRSRFADAKFDPTETVVTPDSIFNDDQLLNVTP